MSWQGVSNADYYTFSISIDPYGSDHIIYRSPHVYGTSFSLPTGSLNYGSKYRWNIRAWNSAGASEYSNTLYFQTPAAPAQTPSTPTALRLIAAGNGYIHFAWSPPLSDGGSAITYYKIYRGTCSDCLVLIDIIPSSSTQYVDELNIINDTTYFYKVKAVNNVGESKFSALISATPKDLHQKPASTALILPGKGSIITSEKITFLWSKVKSAEYYQLCIGEDSSLKMPIYSNNYIENYSFILETSKLKPNKSYFWSVRAHNKNGWGEYNEASSFFLSGNGVFLSNIPEKHMGTVQIPKSMFSAGKGAKIPIYIPPVINNTNAGTLDGLDGWNTVWKKELRHIEVDWESFFAHFNPPGGAETSRAGAINFLIGLLKAGTHLLVISKIKITVQKNPNKEDELRAIIQVSPPNTFLQEKAGQKNLRLEDYIDPGLFSTLPKELISKDPSKTYLYRIDIDQQHSNSYGQYLSVKENRNIVFSPKVYPNDCITIIEFDKSNKFKLTREFLKLYGSSYVDFLGNFTFNSEQSKTIRGIFSQANITLIP